ncbi:trigger factor [Borrelia turcica IST7]|uniref:Trigger factor n=1 Tax=Borrelia turcica IST7 TaxID=1104446 RepID=A0A386PLC3_9SPIR|nr:trigger factor [Borrelia turcica]AYE36466.1 trigger factor [Borrelia turcica IST7]
MILSNSVKLLPDSKVEAVIRISKEFVKGKYNEFLKDYSSRLKVQGFRTGKVPFSIIESKYSSNLKALTVEKVIHKSLEDFFKSAVYKPLSYATPKILDEKLDIDFEKDFEFTVVYEAYPEFEIPDISNILVEIPEVIVSDSDVENELKLLQTENSIVVEDKDGVKKGSIVRVNFVELDDSLTEILSTRRQDFVFTVGESNNYYGFDEDIIGMKKDEERIVEKTYGEDYRFRELAGSVKKLKITVEDIKRRDVPELDDDFAKDINDSLNTLEELKEHIRANMLKLVKEKEKDLKLSKLLSDVSEKLNIEVPPAMFEAELNNALNQFSEQNKISIDQLRSSLNELEGEDYIFKDNVLKNLKSKLILQKMVDNDGEEVTDIDLEQYLARQAEDTKMELAEIRKFYEERNLLRILKDEIKRQKVKDKILENVKEIRINKISFRDFVNYEMGK